MSSSRMSFPPAGTDHGGDTAWVNIVGLVTGNCFATSDVGSVHIENERHQEVIEYGPCANQNLEDKN